jgi:hypothetical protein
MLESHIVMILTKSTEYLEIGSSATVVDGPLYQYPAWTTEAHSRNRVQLVKLSHKLVSRNFLSSAIHLG